MNFRPKMAISNYLKKLLDAQFKDISEKRWYETIVLWCIDSKFRRYMRLDHFLKKQITNPDWKLSNIANLLRSDNPYTTVSRIEEYVIRNFTYKSDEGEEWLDAIDVYLNKRDDCDGQNSLIWVMCILAGIDNDMIYCTIGDTSSGYHFWVLFFDARRNRMVKLDASYYPEVSSIAKKPEFKLGSKYKRIDYIFNDERVYAFR